MNNHKSKILLVLLLCVVFFAFFYFDLSQYLNLEYVKDHRDKITSFYSSNPLFTFVGYFILYVVAIALSIPGALVLTVFSGFLFGLVKGTLLVSFASTLGATLIFLISRFLLREFFTQKFGTKLSQVISHLKKEGAFYLFSLRLIPIIPFFLINILMGLSPIKTRTFYIVSQISMLPMTIIYVNAGDQLAQIDNLKDLVSFKIILSLILVVFFSFFIKKIWAYISSRKSVKIS